MCCANCIRTSGNKPGDHASLRRSFGLITLGETTETLLNCPLHPPGSFRAAVTHFAPPGSFRAAVAQFAPPWLISRRLAQFAQPGNFAPQ